MVLTDNIVRPGLALIRDDWRAPNKTLDYLDCWCGTQGGRENIEIAKFVPGVLEHQPIGRGEY